jgi:hypothetical protein
MEIPAQGIELPSLRKKQAACIDAATEMDKS